MPQMSVWPFMARTMVEDVHGVKPLPFAAAACRRRKFRRAATARRDNGTAGRRSLAVAASRESVTAFA
jgi:hypothetical protein